MSRQQLRTLIIEDPSDPLLILDEFGRSEYDVIHERVQNAAELRAALERETWDIILSDYSLPDFGVIDALKIVHEFDEDLPLIIISSVINEKDAVRAMRAGAADCFLKDRLMLLMPAIEREVRDAQHRRERKQAEKRLRQAEQRFSTTFYANPIGIVITRASDGRVIDINPRFTQMTGYAPEDLIGKNGTEVDIWISEEQRLEIAMRLQSRGALKDEEIQFRYASGEPGWALLSTANIDIDNEPCVLSMVYDITERKRAQQEVVFQAELLNAVGQAIIATDVDAKIVYWGVGAEKMHGWRADEVMGQDAISAVVADDAVTKAKIIMRGLYEGQSWTGELEMKRRGGETFPVLLNTAPLYGETGELIGLVGALSDISHLKAIEQAARNAERFATATVDSLSAHIAILDETGTIIAVNESWEEYGRANGSTHPNAYRGENYLEVCDQATGMGAEEARAVAAGIRSVINGERDQFSLEYPCQSYAGLLWFNLNVTRFRDEGPVRVVVTHEDITARKMTEDELRALYNATSYLFKADSLQNLGHQIVQATVKEFGVSECTLMLVDKTTNRVLHLANVGTADTFTGVSLRLNKPGLVSRVVKSGQPIYIADTASAPQDGLADTHVRSKLVIPLKVGDGVIGVLDMQSPTPNAFTERDRRILLAFADRAATALQVLQLYDELNQHAAKLEWRVALRTAELARAKDWVEAILSSTTDVIILSDVDGNLIQANPVFQRQFQYEPEALLGKPLTNLLARISVQAFKDAVKKAVETDQPVTLELVCIRQDDTLFEAEFSIAPLVYHGQDQDETNIVHTVRDITRHKQIEASLRKALAQERELNELKTRFSSMVSHEFRTPLTIILSSVGLIRNYGDRLSPEKQQEKLENIEVQVNRLVQMLDDILSLNRAENVALKIDKKRVDPDAIFRQIITEIHQTTSSHRINYITTGDNRPVLIDANLLGDVVRNLLTNAVKYSPSTAEVELECVYEADRLLLHVKDHGIGIPEEDQPRLFEMFHRGKNARDISGTGLGLAIVERAVNAHGGTISVESRVNEGTTFTVTLPLEDHAQN